MNNNKSKPEDWQIAQLIICVALWAFILIGIGRAL